MKEMMEFDFEKFVNGLKQLNLENGYKGLDKDAIEEDTWRVSGYQDCLEDVIDLFKECLE